MLSSRAAAGETLYTGDVFPGCAADALVHYKAAAPADRRGSYAGSALPFPSPEVAYTGTPNAGSVLASAGRYTLRLYYPNTFYTALGTRLVPPHILVTIGGRTKAVFL
jgi:hypothetical protein